MNLNKRILIYKDIDWQAQLDDPSKNQILNALEAGKVVYFPELTLDVPLEAWSYLSDRLIKPNTKHISYDMGTDRMKGMRTQEQAAQHLKNVVRAFARQARDFVYTLLPDYQSAIQVGRTSYRPAEILGRLALSKRKDDTLLHVDAFPSTPMNNNRILRLFVNINPEGKSRVWRLGEPMSEVVNYFKPRLKKPVPMTRRLMRMLRMTRSYRTLYDHYMLQLHDHMKLDNAYQQTVDQIQFEFQAKSTWMVFSDVVSHAALSEQHVLEQTFYVPVDAMRDPELSPHALLKTAVSLV